MIVRIRDIAESELEAAFDYYESKQVGLGQRFLDDFISGVHQIAEAPNRWPVDPDVAEVRRYRLHRFPYALIYRILADRCEIIAVMNLHRRPGYWRDRLT